jgi:hypothetical protein
MPMLRERFDAWLAGRKNRDSERAAIDALLAVVDACDAAIAAGRLAPAHVELLLAALGDKSSMLSANARELVGWLQACGVDTEPVLRPLFTHKRAKLRVLALRCLDSGAAPNSLVDELLLAGLSDKDPDVQMEAASLATLSFRKKWLAPHLDALAAVSVGGERLRRLLVHGHVANRLPDGSLQLEVLARGFGTTHRTVGAEDVAAQGLAAVVERIRAEPPFLASDRDVVLPVEEERVLDESRPNRRHPWAPLYRSVRPA